MEGAVNVEHMVNGSTTTTHNFEGNDVTLHLMDLQWFYNSIQLKMNYHVLHLLKPMHPPLHEAFSNCNLVVMDFF